MTAFIVGLPQKARSVLVGYFDPEQMAAISKAGEAETVALLADVEALIASKGHGSSFTPLIERHFSDVTRQARERIFILAAVAGVTSYNLFLLVDGLVVPDFFWLGIIMQLAITTPVTLVLIVAVALGKIRSDYPAVVVLGMMLATTLIWLWLARGAHTGTFACVLQLMILGSNIVLGLPFAVALGFTAAANVATALVLSAHPTMEPGPKLFVVMLTLVASLYSLIGNYRIVAGLRNAFLFAIVERLRADQLLVANTHLQGLVDIDGLTSIGNRRAFDKTLSLFWGAARKEATLALLFIDIDHFKALNDTHGHLVGDACLIQVARALAEGMRSPRHVLARYGGEEFGVLLSGGDIDEAFKLGEELRRSIEELVLTPVDGASSLRVTVSLGCAALDPGNARASSELVAAADEALYRAKQAGRNRTVRSIAIHGTSPVGIDFEGREVSSS